MNKVMWKRMRSVIASAMFGLGLPLSLGMAVLGLSLVSPALATGGPRGVPTILYVDDDAPAGGDGLSWTTAFDDLQAALEATSEPGSEIRVGQGLYLPTERFDPAEPRSATFQLISGVTLRGGYGGLGASDPNAWDPATFITTFSGDLNGDDGPDSANNGENALHVLRGDGLIGKTVLEGAFVTGGNANIHNVDTFTHLGGGVLLVEAPLTVRSCLFSGNAAGYGSAIYARQESMLSLYDSRFAANLATGRGCVRPHTGSATHVERCFFIHNVSEQGSGGIDCSSSPLEVFDSEFLFNQGGVGSGVYAGDEPAVLERCVFRENISGGPAAVQAREAIIRDCVIQRNHAGSGPGGIMIGDTYTGGPSVITNCLITDNFGHIAGGGVLAVNATFVNCVISNNHSSSGGGIFIGGPVTMINCTVAGNSGSGVVLSNSEYNDDSLDATNCIFWGNVPEQVILYDGSQPPPPPLAPSPMTVSFSNIQGGWNGAGDNNIHADPFFVQPGCSNFRLGDESPCLNAGSNAAIPPGVTTDIDGQPRIQDGVVDMGAYEGAFDMLDPAACDEDVDAEETAMLAPLGYGYNPVAHSLVQFSNMIGPDNAFASLTHFDADLHADAGGFSELGPILRLETSIADGQHYSRMFLSIDVAMLGDIDPLSVDLTRFDANSNNWTLAAAGNTVNSPGHDDPVGDRIVTVGTGTNYGLAFDMGDHGVFWNPDLQRGFVWANVDAAGEFAVGAPLSCPADCAVPTDGQVDVQDLLTVIAQWGSAVPNTTADINGDGAVDVDDLVAVILAWGVCSS